MLSCMLPSRQQYRIHALSRDNEYKSAILPHLADLDFVKSIVRTLRLHCQTMPFFVLTDNLDRPVHNCPKVLQKIDAKLVFARATASDEIVHTPHIHHADTSCPPCSQLDFTHTHTSLAMALFPHFAFVSNTRFRFCHLEPRPPNITPVSQISRPRLTTALPNIA